MVRENDVYFRVAWLLFIFVEKGESTHSVHVITECWWKEVSVEEEEEPTKNYIKLSNCTWDGSGNNAEHSQGKSGISFLKLNGKPGFFFEHGLYISLNSLPYTVSQKNGARTLCRITVTKNRALWIKFGTVNRKSISYNLPLKLLMQQSTSCSHCHDNQVTCHRRTSLPSYTRIHLAQPLAT